MNTPLNPAAALVQPLSKSAADRNFADSTPGPGKGATPEVGGTWGKGIFTITTDPAQGGIVLQGRDILTQQAVPALHIQDWEGLFPSLQQPENEAFLKLVVGVMTPMAGKTVGDFTRWAMERNPNHGTLITPIETPKTSVTIPWGGNTFELHGPDTGGKYTLMGTERGSRRVDAQISFSNPEELVNIPENNYLTILINGNGTTYRTGDNRAVESRRNFIDLLKRRIAQQGTSGESGDVLNEGLDTGKFYYVGQQAGQRYVRVATGSLLKEGAETVGRMSGKAVKRPGNLHEILVLTGAQVLAEGIELR